MSVNSLELERNSDRAVELAEEGCILRGLVGSTVHELANGGTDDRDELGVCIEPPEYLLGCAGSSTVSRVRNAKDSPPGRATWI